MHFLIIKFDILISYLFNRIPIVFLYYVMRNASNTHSETLFDWLKFTWPYQIMWVPYNFDGTYVNFNQSKRVCVKEG